MHKSAYCEYIKRKYFDAIHPALGFLVKLISFVCLSFIVIACEQAEPEPQNYHIGVINPNKGTQSMNRGFIEGLAEYGYEEGQNTTFISALNKTGLDKTLLEMIRQNVDLIFTVTTGATKNAITAAKTKNIPVVFALYDPVSSGIIKSHSTVGKNITGIKMRGNVPKALDWLLKLSPGIKTILVPFKLDTPATKKSLNDLRKAALTRDIKLIEREINTPTDIPEMFQNMPDNIDAVFLVHSIFISSHTEKIAKEAAKRKLPLGGGTSTYHKGALITFGVNGSKVGRQASRMAHLILQGAKTEDIPLEIADFYLGINLETAHNAGIPVSNTILSHADYIIPFKNNGIKNVEFNTQ
jgi:putative ABC transport system substrate-binding protein